MNARAFEWRSLVYCDCCNPSRRLERTCEGAVMRRAGGEHAICVECLRAIHGMGFVQLTGFAPECTCGAPLTSRHGLRAELGRVLELHLKALTAATAFELLRVGVKLERCEACADREIERAALELAGDVLERATVLEPGNGGEHDA